eukprot:GFUD01010062.1.p1 GENE.GFUD01010062.1~~GFUD01010062.1.p1  ORF type:complete len:1099 (-),score=183.15 GFUD01010062.1:71-3367(-)
MSSDPKAKPEMLAVPLVFGTYRIKGEVLDDSASQALHLFRQQGRPLLLDGAAKYGNTDVVLKIMKRFPEAELGWKVESKSREKSVQEFVQALAENHIPHHRVFRILLHNYAGKKSYLEFQHLVDQAFGKDMMPIGICNITAEQLEDLIIVDFDEAENAPTSELRDETESGEKLATSGNIHGHPKNVKARVNYVQNEYHPFLQTNVPQLCKKHSIHFEAHSTMWGNLEDYETVLKEIMTSKVTNEKGEDQNKSNETSNEVKGAGIETKSSNTHNLKQQTTAQLVIAFAANALKDFETDEHRPVSSESEPELSQFPDENLSSVCFTTTNYSHLVEISNTCQISPDLLLKMRQMCHYKRVVRYKGSTSKVNTNWVKSCDVDYIKAKILPQIKRDIELFKKGNIPSDLCTKIPKHYQKEGKVHLIIAKLLYFEFLKEQNTMTKEQNKLHYFGKKHKDSIAKAWDELDENDEEFANQRLSLVLKKMRKHIEDIKKDARHTKKVATCTIKAVTNPEALPVDSFPDASEFDDLNSFIINMSSRQKQSHKERKDCPTVYSNIRFKYGTLNMDGRLDLCKQGVKNAYIDSCDAIIADGDYSNVLFEDGTINNCEPIVQDRNDIDAAVRFKYGTLNSDGRLDLCKQGVKKAYVKSCKAVVVDGEDSNTRFQHGTLNSDGRLDLCKQGVKNAYTETCEAVAKDGDSNTASGRAVIKHYLLGNNVIGDDSDGLADVRIGALCNMISKRPDIQTWYLAGNALSPGYIALVAEALLHTRARYIWFKMNPIKDGCFSLAELIQNNPNIELLDLFNCGICDSGLLSFCNTLIETGKNKLLKTGDIDDDLETNEDGVTAVSSINDILTLVSETQHLNGKTQIKQEELVKSFRALNFSNLKHLYFGINDITDHGINALFCIFAILSENLESIYIHSNPIKDAGLKTFYDKIKAYGVTFPKLKRLSAGSCGLTDSSLPILKGIINLSPNLVSLDLSSYKSTNYFGQVHNIFTNTDHLKDIATALKANATKSGYPDKNYIGFQHAFQGQDQVEVKALVDDIADKLEMNVNGIQYKNEDVAKDGMLVHKKLTKRELSEIIEPYPAIDYIQSIYRNTMKL